MSMTEREIERLERLKDKNFYPESADYRIIGDAIDTIKTQSEKLHAYVMELSRQHYYDEWIPCDDEHMPETDKDVLITLHNGEVTVGFHHVLGYIDCWYISDCAYGNDEIIAWRPLPEPYKGE